MLLGRQTALVRLCYLCPHVYLLAQNRQVFSLYSGDKYRGLMMPKLTPKQARFVEEYLIDLNATQAAIRAGYSDKFSNSNAPKLLQNTAIAEAIKEAQAKLSEACQVSQKMVIDGLLVEARLKGDGSSHSARVSAWGLLGKHLGMFVEKTENKTEVIVKAGLEHFYSEAF